MVATNDPVIATIYETYDYGKFKRLWKWYRRDKCEAKINEEKELYKED